MKIKKNDEVIVIAGNEKGKTGKVLSVNGNRVKISGIKIIKKHIKPSQNNTDGGIKETEGTVHISNVSHFIKGKDGGPSKIGYKFKENKKIRFYKKNGKELS